MDIIAAFMEWAQKHLFWIVTGVNAYIVLLEENGEEHRYF